MDRSPQKMPNWHTNSLWQMLLSRLFGCFANLSLGPLCHYVIRRYIQYFQVDMTEALETQVNQYCSFNEFFTRKLKPDVRPIAHAKIISPVDGQLSEYGEINENQLLQAKNQVYDLASLLADEAFVYHFSSGSYATCYLSPRDYHRIHMPISAELVAMYYVPGQLFPVYPAAVRQVPALFTRNERVISIFKYNENYLAVVMVGAMVVGAIKTIWHGLVKGRRQQIQQWDYSEQPIVFNQGDEIGQFQLGSCVILLTSEKIKWCENLQVGQAIKMGQALGK